MISKRFVCASLFACALALVVGSAAQAATVNWTIDSSQSYVTLAIPNQKVTYTGITITADIRNNGSNANGWTVGNKAQVTGTFSTDYTDGASVKFNSGLSNMKALEGGSFNPDQSTWNGTTFTNPTAKAKAAYGFLAHGTAFVIVGLNIGNADMINVQYDASSNPLAISGGGTFSVNGTGFGIASASLGLRGLDPVILGSTIDIPDIVATVGGLLGTNQATTLGSITSGTGLARTIKIPLKIPVFLPIEIDSTSTLNISMTASGFIVATAVIPEPGSVILAVLGCIGFLPLAINRLKRRRS